MSFLYSLPLMITLFFLSFSTRILPNVIIKYIFEIYKFNFIVLFSFEGEVILQNYSLVALLAAPKLLHYLTMIVITYTVSWLSNWTYETSIITTLIGSSSHFEVAIAVATTLYGIGSGAALATVIGPLMEVPLMISLTKFGLWSSKYFPRKKTTAITFIR